MKKSGYFYGRLISTYGQRLRHYRVDAWLRVLIWFMLLLLCFRWWVGHVNLVMYITFHANMIHLWCLASLKHKTSQHPQHSNSTIRLHHSPNHPSLHNLPPIINIPARIHIQRNPPFLDMQMEVCPWCNSGPTKYRHIYPGPGSFRALLLADISRFRAAGGPCWVGGADGRCGCSGVLAAADCLETEGM